MSGKSLFLFSNRKSEIDVAGRLARLVNLTTPNMLLQGDERRSTNRANRSLPVLLAAWENDEPVADETTMAITKDIGDTGISLILCQPLRMDQLVVGFWMPDEPGNLVDGTPFYVLTQVITNTPLGGGFWQCGVRAECVLTLADYPQLEVLSEKMQHLAPPRTAFDSSDELPPL